MGMVETEQAVRIIEASKDEPSYVVPILVAVITVIGGIITTMMRRKK